MSRQNYELHLFQLRNGDWVVRVDGLPQGRQYTLPEGGIIDALEAAAMLFVLSEDALAEPGGLLS